MKKAAVCLCLLLCLALACACSGAPTLVGTWQHEAAPITYEFRADGTLSLTTESLPLIHISPVSVPTIRSS